MYAQIFLNHTTPQHTHSLTHKYTFAYTMLYDVVGYIIEQCKNCKKVKFNRAHYNKPQLQFSFNTIRFDSIQFDSNQLSRIYYYPHIRCISIKSNRLHKCQSVHDLSRNGFALLWFSPHSFLILNIILHSFLFVVVSSGLLGSFSEYELANDTNTLR